MTTYDTGTAWGDPQKENDMKTKPKTKPRPKKGVYILLVAALAGCVPTRTLTRIPEAVSAAVLAVEIACAEPKIAETKECKRALEAVARIEVMTPELMALIIELLEAIEAVKAAK